MVTITVDSRPAIKGLRRATRDVTQFAIKCGMVPCEYCGRLDRPGGVCRGCGAVPEVNQRSESQ